MSQAQSAPDTCDSCRQLIPVCGGVSHGSLESGYRELCNRCLMSFEGWQFKLEIYDRSKEI